MRKKTAFVFFTVMLMLSCNSNTDTNSSTENNTVEETKEVASVQKATQKLDTKSIVGKWKTDFEGTVAQLSEEKKQKMAESLQLFEQTFAGIVNEYKENGAYLHNGGIATIEGMTKWEISANKLEIKEGDAVVFSYEIVELSSDRLVLKSNNEGEIFPVTVYTKLKKINSYNFGLKQKRRKWLTFAFNIVPISKLFC